MSLENPSFVKYESFIKPWEEDDFERTQRRIAQLKVRIADAAMEEYRLSIMLAGSFTSEVEAEKKTMSLCAELAELEGDGAEKKS